MIYIYIYWVVPPPSKSHHQDYCITFLVGNPYKPSFPLLLGGGTTQYIYISYNHLISALHPPWGSHSNGSNVEKTWYHKYRNWEKTWTLQKGGQLDLQSGSKNCSFVDFFERIQHVFFLFGWGGCWGRGCIPRDSNKNRPGEFGRSFKGFYAKITSAWKSILMVWKWIWIDIPFLKLTASILLKINAWSRWISILLACKRPIFSGEAAVSFRECKVTRPTSYKFDYHLTISNVGILKKLRDSLRISITFQRRFPDWIVLNESWISQIQLNVSGIFRDPQEWDPLPILFPYYSHTTPIRIPKDMGMVWE